MVVDASAGVVKEDGGWFISGCLSGRSLSSERSGENRRGSSHHQLQMNVQMRLCGCNPSVFKHYKFLPRDLE